jgi:hypothetical protein
MKTSCMIECDAAYMYTIARRNPIRGMMIQVKMFIVGTLDRISYVDPAEET